MKFYVCGGDYADFSDGFECRVFGLVRPSEDLPYVRHEGESARELYNLARHHSHLYSFYYPPRDLFSSSLPLVLEEESFEAATSGNRIGVGAPKTVEISGKLLADLGRAIELLLGEEEKGVIRG